MLKDMGFAPYPGKEEDSESADYGYLLGMSMWSMTTEKVTELVKKSEMKTQDVEALEKMTVEDMWTRELDKFEQAYRKSIGSG
jgi:DNA topoisomerase-2